jgi:nitronate monooxygenase
MFDLTRLEHPIVQAPMAGGPSTPELAIAVSEAGGLGFLAAGYIRANALSAEIEQLRAETERPFGINLFVIPPNTPDETAVSAYLRELAPEAERLGVELGEPRWEDDDWQAKLELLCADPVPVVSFAFGLPGTVVIEALHAAGSAVWVTVGSAAEAKFAAGTGVDALILQGTEAGGHRGGLTADAGIAALELTRRAAGVTTLPLIAAGGIADGPSLAAVLDAGAAAAQIGTAFMLAPEAATNAAHRELISGPGETGLTRAFTGRLARGIVNRFQTEHSATALSAYPQIHHVTSPLRAAARAAGDASAFNLWAGQAHELAQALPAGEIVRALSADALSARE